MTEQTGRELLRALTLLIAVIVVGWVTTGQLQGPGSVAGVATGIALHVAWRRRDQVREWLGLPPRNRPTP